MTVYQAPATRLVKHGLHTPQVMVTVRDALTGETVFREGALQQTLDLDTVDLGWDPDPERYTVSVVAL